MTNKQPNAVQQFYWIAEKKSLMQRWHQRMRRLVVLYLLLAIAGASMDPLEDDGSNQSQSAYVLSLRQPHVAEIHLNGPISFGNTLLWRSQIMMALTNPSQVKGIVVYIESPGGEAPASEYTYRLLKRCQRAKIPVTAVVPNIAASGGYIAALGAEHIIALPSALIGSIGVFSGPIINPRQLLKNNGINIRGVSLANTPDYNPDGTSTVDKRQADQQSVQQIFDTFRYLVKDERQLPRDTLNQVATGQVFDAWTAKQYHLIDEVTDQLSRPRVWLQENRAVPTNLPQINYLKISQQRLHEKRARWPIPSSVSHQFTALVDSVSNRFSQSLVQHLRELLSIPPLHNTYTG